MKTNLDKYFKSDVNLEKTGVWYEISDEIGFLVKRSGGSNKEYSRQTAKAMKKYSTKISHMPEDVVETIVRNLWIENCLVDWKGIEIDGKDQPYDVDVAKKLLSKREYEDLLNTLISHSDKAENYREGSIESLGNS